MEMYLGSGMVKRIGPIYATSSSPVSEQNSLKLSRRLPTLSNKWKASAKTKKIKSPMPGEISGPFVT